MSEILIGKFKYNHNYFYITKNEKETIKYWIQENSILKSIEIDTHKRIVKEVIKNLNHIRYMLISSVKFEEESYLWYVNSYISQSIFVNKETKEICEYEENKDLYEKYNLNPNVVYISENTKKYFNENVKSKAKVIKIAILGVAMSIMLTSTGIEFLSKNKLDENSTINNQEEINFTDIKDIKMGTTIEILQSAISNNNRLTQEEKEFIIQNFKEFFDDAKQYMNQEEIVSILETLEIKYEYKENLKDGTTAGDYDRGCNIITFYVGNNIEEVINHSKIVPMHEVFHSLQSFGFGKIMEGITEVYAEEYGEQSSTAYYPNEKLWAKLLLEVFGKDLILQDSLNGGVLQYIPERIAKLSENATLNSAQSDMMNLISDINDSIEYLEKKKFSVFLKSFHENQEDEKRIQGIFARLENYDKILNGREKNKMIDIYKDAILKTNNSELLENDGEYISNVYKNYFTNREDTIKIEISNNDGGYEYKKKDKEGNIIQSGKIPFRNVIVDIDGNILYKEELNTTMQNILEEYNRKQEDYER